MRRSLVLSALLVACAGEDDLTDTPPVDTGTAGDSARVDSTSVDDTAVVVDAPATGAFFRVANLRSETFAVCHKKKGEAAWVGPIFGPEGGVRSDQVSTWIPITNADYDVSFVAPGGDCAGTLVFTASITLAAYSGAPRLTVFVRPMMSSGFLQNAPLAADKDTVYFLADGRNGSFVPDAAGGTPIVLGSKPPATIAADVVGKIVQMPATTDRPFKTRAGGQVTIFGHGTALIVCDDLAPPVGHLSDCSATVRAP